MWSLTRVYRELSDHTPLLPWWFPSDPARTRRHACAKPTVLMLAARASAALIAFTPVVIHDSHERSPLTSASAHAPIARDNDTPPRRLRPRDPRQQGGTWLQYWLYYAYQDQDRGIVKTGRHAGDWELVQYRVDDNDHLLEAIYAQHSGAERCGANEVEFSGQPIVYAAHGSHASYFHAGMRDRTWPDPNDEADGKGKMIRPQLVEISATDPRWMTYPGPWGPSRANRFIPGEQTSPKGPYFQPDRWNPETFAANAGPCKADCNEVDECDDKETKLGYAALFLFVFVGILRPAPYRYRSETPSRYGNPVCFGTRASNLNTLGPTIDRNLYLYLNRPSDPARTVSTGIRFRGPLPNA